MAQRDKTNYRPESVGEAVLPTQEANGFTWRASCLGAYVLQFGKKDGTQLLLEDRTMPGGSRRGGVFAACPVFGPDARSHEPQPQHGYLRLSMCTAALDTHSVEFQHTQDSGLYAGLITHVRYEFNSGVASGSATAQTLHAEITVLNRSNRTLRIAPALHPYIDLSSLDAAAIQGLKRDLQHAPTISASEITKDIGGGREVVVGMSGFQRLTMWSGDDDLPYVCIEPSLAGDSCSKRPYDPDEIEMLEPDDSREMDMSITWRDATPDSSVKA